MGVRSQLDVKGAYVPSIGLGSIAVSPLDIASSYATLAAEGVYAEPMAIRRVVLADGTVDTEAGWGTPRRRRAISEGTAAIVTRILEQNVQSGTGTRAAFGRPAAGKTGTAELNVDAWFAGYTPELATAVWMGYTSAEIPLDSVHGIAVTGGSFPAEMWRLFMEPALDNVEPAAFPEPKVWPTWKPFTRGEYALDVRPDAGRNRDRRHGVLDAEAASAAGVGPLTHDVSDLLTIDDALARIVENAQLLAGGDASPSPTPTGRVLREPATAQRRPSSVSELGDGRLRRSRGGRRPASFRSRSASPRERRRRAHSRRARPPGSRRAARCRPKPMLSSRSRSSKTAGATS